MENRARPKDATAKAVNASLILENFDEAVNTTLQILGEGAGCKRINILENFFDIIQQLKLDFSSLRLYRKNGSKARPSRMAFLSLDF